MSEFEMTLVTVAPGHSMRDPGKVTTARVHVGNGIFEDRVVDVETRVVMPGDTIKVFTRSVSYLIKLGTILDPATAASAQEFAAGPGERTA